MDIGLRNLDLTLGMSDRALMDFSDVMDFRCPLSGATVEQPEIKGLFLLTAPLTPEGLDRLSSMTGDWRNLQVIMRKLGIE